MTETADDLSAPLGQDKPRRKRRLRLPFTAMQLLAVLLFLFLVTFAGFAIFNKDPLGGEPMMRIAIHEPKTTDKAIEEKPAAAGHGHDSQHEAKETAKQAAPSEQKTVTMIDGSTGARHDVVIGAGEATDKGGAASAPPPVMAGIEPKLLEKSRYGMIPVVAGDLKPFNVYAADADRAKAAKMPVVAIVIGGLGVGAAKTTDAIMKLPPAVTLAFTPYGSDPGKLAERARAQRHEVFLQIPMEPYDFPDNDPGPQTLLTSLSTDQNMDRLYWHLSRMQGYAGLANFMGARFIATEPAMQPIIREAAKRGLGFFDDGSSPRSIASQAAANQAMPFGKGDIAIDVVPTPTEIDRALNKLEATARERGAAIGTASALPVSIERIAAWTKSLGDRGILLVPLTTAMLKSKSS
ncbi:divergent polysaccharide deacetylase family protein [Bradyrhizobium sp. 147]|uniref:divergent polysaccharide deacetylase family protein n=1 Tax=unclassified Bradyrhizobium TaxID=2631580 RepID=UPI001FF8A72B|nr:MULTISPECIES: divergent polysaccharide deacetylase family protein [unclassified Bradyrhizobium]MCK1543148.1 divergent polysaccharide deacetylase family protein [Bradyrhizobium sp. 179]MCK1627757.1 divergent polysaccharide deacetylase family protein [Bradyrhizobium sp. 160]MCK1678372.1 divergent polysaccharide deacetylase family protein [Bradyrhizobium sp. 147]